MDEHVIGGTIQSTVWGNIGTQSPFLDHNAFPFHSKCSKISNTFLIIVDGKSRTHIMLVRISNREDPGQTASSEAV